MVQASQVPRETEMAGMRPQKRIETVTPLRGPALLRKGYKKALLRLTEAQLLALRKEAARRAAEAGSIRADMSALVREALDAWLTKAGGKR